MNNNNSTIVGHLSCAGAYTIFGLNIVFCKDIANCGLISPIALFTMRAIGAASLFWLISLFLPKQRIEKGDLWKIACASFLGFFMCQITFLVGIQMVTSIDASIISTLSPIFTMFIAALFIKEPVTWKKLLGVAISFAGVVFLIMHSITSGHGAASTSPLGIFLLLLNSLSFAAYLGIFKPLISKYHVVTFMKWIFLFALLISVPFSASDLVKIPFAQIPGNVALEIGFLIFFATFVAYFLIPIGQKRIRPTLVSMYSYVQPVLAVIISIIIGMDRLTLDKVIAILFVVSGVLIVNRSRSLSSK